MLTSLIRALEECDSDTEQHVRRTQELGAELGRRIELSDIQQSKLALLCLLHDIGKVGVPMEILNKPGNSRMRNGRSCVPTLRRVMRSP